MKNFSAAMACVLAGSLVCAPGCDNGEEAGALPNAGGEEQTAETAAPAETTEEPVLEKIVIDGDETAAPAALPGEETQSAAEIAPPPAPSLVAPYDPATIAAGIEGASAMGYAALDGTGEFRGAIHETGPVGEQKEFFAVGDAAGSYTNAAGAMVTSGQYAEMGRVAMGDASRPVLSSFTEKPKNTTSEEYARLVMAYTGVKRLVDLKATHDWTKESLLVPKGRERPYTAQNLGSGLYEFVDYGADGAGRTYVYMFMDGQTCRATPPFAFEPDSEIMAKSIIELRRNPAALNNLAAMVYNGLAKSGAYSKGYVEWLLVVASSAGEPMACRNLAIFYSDPGRGIKDDRKRDYYLAQAAALAAQSAARPPMDEIAVKAMIGF